MVTSVPKVSLKTSQNPSQSLKKLQKRVDQDSQLSESTLSSRHLSTIQETSTDQLIIFEGNLNKKSVRILIDSGVVGNYISESIAKNIESTEKKENDIKVTVADGRTYHCRLLKKGELKIRDYQDHLDFIIALIVYDIILGKTW